MAEVGARGIDFTYDYGVQHLARRDVCKWGEEHNSRASVAAQRVPDKTPVSFKQSVFGELQGLFEFLFKEIAFFSLRYPILTNI